MRLRRFIVFKHVSILYFIISYLRVLKFVIIYFVRILRIDFGIFLFVHLSDSINNDAYLSNIAVVKLNLVLTWVCLYFSWIKFLFKNLRPPFSMITNKRINSKKLVTRKYVKLVSKPLLKSKMCDVFLGIDDHRSWANKSLQIMFFFERFLNVFFYFEAMHRFKCFKYDMPNLL